MVARITHRHAEARGLPSDILEGRTKRTIAANRIRSTGAASGRIGASRTIGARRADTVAGDSRGRDLELRVCARRPG